MGEMQICRKNVCVTASSLDLKIVCVPSMQKKIYSVSILYGNIGIFRDLEAFLAQKSGGKPTNLQCTIGFCPWFWSRPPKLS